MTRLQKLFTEKNSNVLNVYCTAGYPELDSTLKVMKALQDNGRRHHRTRNAIQRPAGRRSCDTGERQQGTGDGMTIAVLFEQLKDLRKEINIPVLLMGYMNPVLQYGFEKFCKDAAALVLMG
jgi:tryptophan synthase alpha chain